MARKNGNGGQDVVLRMWQEIVTTRDSLRRADRSLAALGRGLLRMRAEQKAEIAEIKRRLDLLETASA